MTNQPNTPTPDPRPPTPDPLTPADRLTLQNWITACQQASAALDNFTSCLLAWQRHPELARLSPDLFDDIIQDLNDAGLAGWLQPDRLTALRRAICGDPPSPSRRGEGGEV